MKILNAEQIRAADAYTIANEPIPSIDLMERAATAFYQAIRGFLDRGVPIYLFCGTGNNGGDGLVLARLMQQDDYEVNCYAVRFSDRSSDDFQTNEARLKEVRVTLHDIKAISDFPEMPQEAVIIDAIFGTGLTRVPEGLAAEVIVKINERPGLKISVDIPSGLFAEQNARDDWSTIVRAHHTVSFEVPKLAFFLPENGSLVGQLHVVPIGLHPDFISNIPSDYHLLTEDQIRAGIQPRNKYSHKGTFGHAFLMAGGEGKMGAAILAARACLRAGVGLLTMQVPKCGYEIMQTAVPEAMCVVDEGEQHLTSAPKDVHENIGIGPGIGTEKDTANALKLTIQNATGPMVLDADALNILAENKTWLAFLPKGSILTPHPGEFARLVGNIGDQYERLQALRDCARKWQSYVVLKGAHTAIALPDGQVLFNQTGNPGMATGGSGDVLTGILTGLIAQGYTPGNAVCLGVWLHGLAGDIAASELGIEAMTSGDIVDYIPKAWKHLKRQSMVNQEAG